MVESFELDWISKLTVPKLKEELKSRGQPVGGKKAELVERLESFIKDSEQVSSVPVSICV